MATHTFEVAKSDEHRKAGVFTKMQVTHPDTFDDEKGWLKLFAGDWADVQTMLIGFIIRQWTIKFQGAWRADNSLKPSGWKYGGPRAAPKSKPVDLEKAKKEATPEHKKALAKLTPDMIEALQAIGSIQ